MQFEKLYRYIDIVYIYNFGVRLLNWKLFLKKVKSWCESIIKI